MANERYEKLYTIDKNLYSLGSPVIISAGALLKDNLDDSIIVQIKFMNIVNKCIKSIKVQIVTFDSVGRKLEGVVSFEYLDLFESRDVEFGQKTPIRIPNNKARRFAISIEEVCFDDDTVWHSSAKEWNSIDTQDLIDSIFDNNDIKEQYLIEHGNKSIYQIKEYKDIWMCACGAINHMDEKECHCCGHTAEYFEISDFDELKTKAEKRLEGERKALKTKITKMIMAIVVIVVFVILGIGGKYTYENVIVPNGMYADAKKMYDAQEYEKAKKKFSELGEYKDAKSWVSECDIQITEIENKAKYDSALVKLNAGKYDDAINEFEALNNYSDSKEKLNDAKQMKYEKAYEEYMRSDVSSKALAYEIFTELGDYADSSTLAFQAAEYLNITNYCNARHEHLYPTDEKLNAVDFFLHYYDIGVYRFLSGEEIEKEIVGKWKDYSLDREGYHNLSCNENGSADGNIYNLYLEEWRYWYVKNNALCFGSGCPYPILYINENTLAYFLDTPSGLKFEGLYIRME